LLQVPLEVRVFILSHYLLNICLFYFCGHIIYPAVLKEKLDWIWKAANVFIRYIFGLSPIELSN
jgi:hypothetical protein